MKTTKFFDLIIGVNIDQDNLDYRVRTVARTIFPDGTSFDFSLSSLSLEASTIDESRDIVKSTIALMLYGTVKEMMDKLEELEERKDAE